MSWDCLFWWNTPVLYLLATELYSVNNIPTAIFSTFTDSLAEELELQ